MNRSARLLIPALLLTAACAAGPVQATKPAEAAENHTTEGSAAGNYLAGLHGEATGEWTVAASYLAATAAAAPENNGLRDQAFIIALSAGDLARAEALAPQIGEKGSQAYFARLTQAVQAMRENRPADAARHLKAMEETRLGQFTKPLLLAWVELGLGHQKRAEELLAKIEGDTDIGSLYKLHRAYLAAVLKRPGASALVAEAATRPAPLRAVVAAARQLRVDGKDKEAQALMAQFLIDNPESRLAEIERDRLAQTPPPPPLVTDAKDGMGEALFNLAGAFQQQSAPQLVQIYGYLAESLRPDDQLIRLMLGDTASNRRQWRDALTAYDRIPANSPYRIAGLMRAAAVAETSDEDAEAIALLKQAASLAPEQSDPWQQLGDLYRRTEDYPAALAAYAEAEKRLGPERKQQWVFYYSRAITEFEAKDWTRAEADLQKALTLSPGQPYVLNFLAYSWADQGVRLEEAEKLLRQALAAEPEDGAIIDSVGWVLYRQGKLAEAQAHLERAVLRLPADPEINDHLGDVYWTVGRKTEARFQWQRAYDEAVKRKSSRLIERIGPKLTSGLP